MHGILNALNSTAFNVFGEPTTWAEVFGFITGGLAVYYAARARMATWPWSIANAAFFFVLFLDAKLYADAYLQVFYLVMSVAGIVWWKWGEAIRLHWIGSAQAPGRTKIRRTAWWHLTSVALAVLLFVILFIPHLQHAGDPYPFLDSLTTGLSLGAQYLLSFKRIENWFVWITADLIYIPLYQAKGLTLTAIIYVVFLSLCFLGLRDWRRERRERWSDDPQAARRVEDV